MSIEKNEMRPPNDGRAWEPVIEVLDGEDVLNSLGMSILTGSTIREIAGSSEVQVEAIKRGRRLANEAMAHTGSTNFLDAFPYLALRAGYDVTDMRQRPVFAAKVHEAGGEAKCLA